ncbi:substrate-binding domain-containing protein [Rubrobacter calidifluminis]|uniref:substrate-binding domain-containing protein n=1 Tax=Rubrobacter calidifluminis TaxID=1392640 RepID=UPI00235F4A73|nr:substrate-binding domain-containing protein [Rubrobacter calidifluminis]
MERVRPKISRRDFLAGAGAGFLVLSVGACSGSGSSSSGSKSGGESRAALQAELKKIEGKVLSTGPHGEKATPASEIKLSDQEMKQIKAKKATAAISLHYGGNDWSTGQVNGLKSQFKKMGIPVVAVTDANFDPSKQVSDIRTILAKKPDILVSIPTDPDATASAYRQAVKQGVTIVFMDNVPKGFKPGRDYVSDVSADNYGNGAVAAHLMAFYLGGEGKIGAVYYAVDFFVTNERYDGFKKTIEEKYPKIKIVAQQGFSGSDISGSAEQVASAMLTKYADLNGMWAVWDVPAEGVMAAARNAARNNLVVTTCDLGLPVGIDMASGGIVKGLGAQRPFDQGVTEAKLAGYGLLNKKAPPYVALPALPVTKDNVLKAWKIAYHQPPPQKLKEAAQ